MHRTHSILWTVVAMGLLVTLCKPASAETALDLPAAPGEQFRAALALPAFDATPRPMTPSQDMSTIDVAKLSPDLPDSRGRRSDTRHLLAYQVATVGILYMMPESVTGWSDEDKKDYDFSKWWDNVTNPQWDTDDFYLNYVLHPYWGAAYYVRSRERGFGRRSSFWYSAAMSAAFEFGIEALAEEPSIQDLIVTPVGGLFVGDYFMRVRERIEARNADSYEMPFRDRFVMTMTDPLGALNRMVDGWFGWDNKFMIRPRTYTATARQAHGIRTDGPERTERIYEIRFEYRW